MKRKVFKATGMILILVAIGCLIAAGVEFFDYWKSDKEYSDIAANYTHEPNLKEPGDTFSVDWAALKAQNPDIVGWIKMDSGANYPIVQGKDDSFYLHKGFNKSYNRNGAIFMKAENNAQWTDANTLLYGHNMASGAMFGRNKKYTSKTYCDAHPYFRIYRDDGNCYMYRIYSVEITGNKGSAFQTVFTGKEDFQKYIDDTQKNSMYNAGGEPTAEKRVVTLSTCHGRQGTSRRLLIHGYLERTVKTND